MKSTILHRVFSEDEPPEVLEDQGHYAEGGVMEFVHRDQIKNMLPYLSEA